jgi:hypothetical protein
MQIKLLCAIRRERNIRRYRDKGKLMEEKQVK